MASFLSGIGVVFHDYTRVISSKHMTVAVIGSRRQEGKNLCKAVKHGIDIMYMLFLKVAFTRQVCVRVYVEYDFSFLRNRTKFIYFRKQTQ